MNVVDRWLGMWFNQVMTKDQEQRREIDQIRRQIRSAPELHFSTAALRNQPPAPFSGEVWTKRYSRKG